MDDLVEMETHHLGSMFKQFTYKYSFYTKDFC